MLFRLVHSAQPVLKVIVAGSANCVDLSSKVVRVLFMMQLLGRLRLHRRGQSPVLCFS